MATNTIEAVYLGMFADIDPNEGDFQTDNAGTLVGSVFGGASDPFFNNIDSLTLNNSDDDGIVQIDDS